MTNCETEVSLQETQKAAVAPDLPPGVPRLGALYVYAAGACNLACRHCWITPSFQPGAAVPDGDGKFVRLEHVRSAVEQGKPLGLATAKLTGGEPTLHPQFRDLVTLLAGAGMKTIVETNGTLVDDDLATFLKASGSVTFVSVSLDGAEPGAHEAMRAVPGSFERAVNGIRALRRAGYHPQVICSLYRGNVDQVDRVIALAEELGCGSVKFNLIQELGRGEKFNATQGLGLEEILELNRRVETELVPRTKLRLCFDIPMAFRSLRRFLRGSSDRCGVLGILGMLSGGELSLCGIGFNVPELVYGHIERDALRDVWCSAPGLVDLRRKVPAEMQGVCAECLHRTVCLGSCLANNYFNAGAVNGAYQFCARAREENLFPVSRLKSGGTGATAKA